MESHFFKAVLSFCIIAGSSAFTVGKLPAEKQVGPGDSFQTSYLSFLAKNAEIKCKHLSDSLYKLKWGSKKEKGIIYHLFVAEKWQDLMPLDTHLIFLSSDEAKKSHLLTTSQSSVTLPSKSCYLRLIAEKDSKLADSVRLAKVESLADNDDESIIYKKSSGYSHYITEEVWEQVRPYLIPNNHPAKSFMDQICAKTRILSSTRDLEKAGFKIIFQQKNRGLVVAKHARLPGYLLKMYLDTSTRVEWSLWVLRAKGARVIQNLLDKHCYNYCMKVPQKWIYPVSSRRRPKVSENQFPKDFILIVEDMNLVSDKYNLFCYKNKMTFPRLDALYTVIGEGGLSDSHIKNIPFSVDLKVAFIDTEYVHTWPVHFDWLTNYFSAFHQRYWLKLIGDRQPKENLNP